ncbi:uncharacterized protein A1O9_03478 [Exophiala aquamarina CBS 119918]|uniref:Piwi domain-containing protein n=1 Tax=Exophiala aquamarina CBS 119918 TaxID=1182545 RepID=A0A072PPV4_9EURO|nr:uncharacterized protein A1O9_03478 [Exophiala aquamarina CBS 119918]KEF61906.1 hypothetical protein A1O9_03478 [Exophiala aquamarina CBS 119918]
MSSNDNPSFYPYIRNIAAPGTDNLQYTLPTEFTKRPGFNTTGKAVQVNVNAYKVNSFPSVKIYQYDVVIGSGAEKRMVQRKVWNSSARKDKTGAAMIYDGNRLAWSSKDHGELRLMIDLDQEEGRPSRGDNNSFRLHIKKTREVDISIIQQFLDGRIQMSISVAEAINFMDHLLREGPSQSPEFLSVKRSLFKRNGERADLGGGIEVWRGIYQSMRLAEGKKMVVNLDVANSCFWKPSALIAAVITNSGWRDPADIAARLTPTQTNGSMVANTTHRALQSKFKGVIVKASYQGNPLPKKEWKIHKFSTNNSHQEKLEWKDPNTKQPTGEMLSVAQYFKRKYNTALQFPNLPLVEMTKRNVKYPMEFLYIQNGQRYNTKLNEIQTANMIKFAVSPPATRLKAINEGKSWLNWENDQYLKNYGLKISSQHIQTNARILPPPGIKFGNRVEQPGTKGRWDLKGKTFLAGNPTELVAWGIGVFPGRTKPDKAQIDKFALDFTRAYRNHSGRVANSPPHIRMLPADAGQGVEILHQETGNKFQRRPQLLIFLVQDKQSFHYLRIKKSCDCRFGVVSQVMQIQQVLKGNPQYYSNVLMKVNAKLGGTTSQVLPHNTSGFKAFSVPTMLIGADVSHASPGSQQASMAALTISFDRFGGRYAAACQTNGHRVEMISLANWHNMLKPLATQWMSQVGGGKLPQQVYYLRDGVSEGQFAHVLHQEVPEIKAVLSGITKDKWNGKITVIIASKRHHIRAFPIGKDASDQKGNPLPGCLIERDITMPNEFDFYLYSHIALQGTSRPVHYTILYDDTNHRPETIQNMIYEHCYQYMRSTTSVSLHPAVYYAHIASNRAKAHEDIASSQGPQTGPGFKQGQAGGRSSEPSDSEVKPLMPLFNANGIVFAMWYI